MTGVELVTVHRKPIKGRKIFVYDEKRGIRNETIKKEWIYQGFSDGFSVYDTGYDWISVYRDRIWSHVSGKRL